MSDPLTDQVAFIGRVEKAIDMFSTMGLLLRCGSCGFVTTRRSINM